MPSYATDQIFLVKIPARTSHKQRPLVALHGWGRDHQNLLSLGELLCQERDVYLLDLPGFGKSALPPLESAIPNYLDIAQWILDRLTLESIDAFDLLGHSFGGKVALGIAQKSSKVKKLILMASSGVKANHPFSKKLRLLCLKYSAKTLKCIDHFLGCAFFANWFRPKFGSKDYLAAGPMRAILVRSVQEDISKELCSIQLPTLLLWGEKDTETPLEIALRMKKHLPQAKLISLPLAGHLLVEESPSLCAYFIEKFLHSETPCF